MIAQLRQIKQRLQDQADKIKEIESDWLDEHTKNELMSREIERLRKIEAENKTLNNILIFFDEKLKNNEEYQQVKLDLIGGQEEQIKIEL